MANPRKAFEAALNERTKTARWPRIQTTKELLDYLLDITKRIGPNTQDIYNLPLVLFEADRNITRNTGPLAGMPDKVLKVAKDLDDAAHDVQKELERFDRILDVFYSALHQNADEAEQNKALIDEGEGRATR
jgi:uncharacterized phage infection (PIP) family protein YhgE